MRHLLSRYSGDEINKTGRRRTVLSKSEVIEIFKLKHTQGIFGLERNAVSSQFVGKMFHVSSKTVRDIWVGRTWYRTTYPLDPTREDFRERFSRQPGRPKGSKDSRPRSRKPQTIHSSSVSESNFDSNLPGQVLCSLLDESSCVNPDQIPPSSIDIEASPCEGKVIDASDDSTSSEKANSPFGLMDDVVVDMHWTHRSPSTPEFLDCAELCQFVDPFHDDWQHW